MPKLLKAITISGFKSLKNARIELGALNVLIGSNGSGKSNLASAFRLLRAWVDRGLQEFIAREGSANSILHFGAKQTQKIDARLEFGSKPDEDWATLSLGFASSDQLFITMEAVDVPIENGYIRGGIFESELTDRSSPRSVQDDRLNFLLRLRIAHFHDTTRESRIRSTGDLFDNQLLHGDGRNLAAFLYKLQQTTPEHLRLIENTVKLVAPFFDRFSLAPDGLNPKMIRLRWRELGADEDFGVDHLSDGTLRFIALAAMLQQPKADLPSLLFIDEPELGLHPYAISVLAGLIRQTAHDCQIVVATQSPTLLDEFDPKDVIVVDRVDRATTFRRLDAAALDDWLQEYRLSELWQKNIVGGRPHR